MTTTINEPRRSVAVLIVNPDGSGTVDIDGRVYSLAHDDEPSARRTGLQLVMAHARQTGREVLVTASDQHTEHRLLVDPGGTVHPAPHTVRLLADCDLSDPKPARRLLRAGLLICGLTLVGVSAAAATMLSRDPAAPNVVVVVAPPARLEARLHVAAGPAAAAEQPIRSRPRWAAKPVKEWRPAADWQARSDAATTRQTAAPSFVPPPPSPVVRPQYQPSEPRPERPAAGWDIPGNPAMPPGPYTPQTSP